MHAWKIYVWIFSFIQVGSLIGRQVLRYKKPDAVTRFDVAESYFAILALPALFGFAYHKRSGPHVFWIVYCTLFLVLNVYQFFTPKMKKLYAAGWKTCAATLLGMIVLGAPALWALLAYSFFEPSLWR